MKTFILVTLLIPSMSFALTVKKVSVAPDITVKVSSWAECTIAFVSFDADVHINTGSIADVTVKEVSAYADITVQEVRIGGDVTVSGTRDLILAAAACPQVRRR